MDGRTAHGVDHARFTLGIAAVAPVPAGTRGTVARRARRTPQPGAAQPNQRRLR